MILLFVLGGIGGALCDQIHVQYGILSYPKPFFLDQAWWVAPLFGTATVAIAGSATPFATRVHPQRPRADTFLLGALWFVGAYYASGLFGASEVAYALVLFALYVLRLFRQPEMRLGLTYAVTLAVSGTVFEMTLSSTGAFRYHEASLLNVPLWLPALYLHGAPLALAMSRKIG